MIVLRTTDVRFVRAGIVEVEPFSFALDAGDTYELRQPTIRAASIAARLCGAIVKPTTGFVVVGDYDTRLQAPEAKRRIGFVDAEGFAGNAHAFRCEVAFHADVWGVAAPLARRRVDAALQGLAEESPYARAVALAFVADVSVVVMDRPPAALADQVRMLAPTVGIVRTAAPDAATP